MRNAAEVAAGRQVEKFGSPPGRWLGFFGVAVGVVAVGAAIWDGLDTHWKGAAIGVVVGVISWLVLARPVAAVHEHGVLLRNMARDSFVPASKIERCKAAQTLMIRTSDAQNFHCLGVGRSARSVMRQERKSRSSFPSILSFGGSAAGSYEGGSSDPEHRFANQEQTGGSYIEYIESRITQLGQAAKPDDREPVTAWSIPSLVATAALIVAAVSLFF